MKYSNSIQYWGEAEVFSDSGYPLFIYIFVIWHGFEKFRNGPMTTATVSATGPIFVQNPIYVTDIDLLKVKMLSAEATYK